MIEDAIDVLIIILGFTLFALSHSVLASFKIKRKLADRFGSFMAYYRLFYNIISVVSFAALIWLLPKPDVIIYDLGFPFDLIIVIFQFSSLIGIFWAFRYISSREFLGINQVLRKWRGNYDEKQLDERMTLVIEGPFKYMRHPILFFSGLFLILRPVMSLFYLTCLICIILYIYIGSFYEEKRLIEKFGDQYINYKKEVPGFFPKGLFRKK